MFISSFATRSESVYQCKINGFANTEVYMLKPPSYHNPHCEKKIIKKKLIQEKDPVPSLVVRPTTKVQLKVAGAL